MTMNIIEGIKKSEEALVKNWQIGKLADKEKQHLKVITMSHNENKVFVEKCAVLLKPTNGNRLSYILFYQNSEGNVMLMRSHDHDEADVAEYFPQRHKSFYRII